MPTVEESLALVIETARAGVSQMPRRLESEAERAIGLVERLLHDGWKLCTPEFVHDAMVNKADVKILREVHRSTA